MNALSTDKLIEAALFMIPFLFAMCFHEFAHAWVAKKKGDSTAEIMGRLTLNPSSHVDIWGTLIIPVFGFLFGGFLFGWAKPVPVNSRNLKKPKEDLFWIALAGPLSNVFLFVVGLGMLYSLERQPFITPSLPMYKMLLNFLTLNLYLAAFNLLPLHPLDGGKVLARFLPYNANRWLEDNSHTLQMGLLLVVVMGGLTVLSTPIRWIVNFCVMAVTL